MIDSSSQPRLADWFSCSAFVPEPAQRAVSLQLSRYVNQVHSYFAEHHIEDVNLHVSGSLARGEPAVIQPEDSYRLASDVDLVAIVHGQISSEHPIHDLAHSMCQRVPEIKTTLFLVEAGNAANVQGRFGRDLYHARLVPLIQRQPLVAVGKPGNGRREALEGIVHVLAMPVGNGSARSASTALRIKSGLEALRALVYPSSDQPLRYADLLTAAKPREVADPQVIAGQVRARELSRLNDQITGPQFQRQIMGALRHLLADGHPEDSALVEGLASRVRHRSHVLPLYQIGAVATFLLAENLLAAPPLKSELAQILVDIGRNLDRRCLPTAGQAAGDLARIPVSDLGQCDPSALALLARALGKIRDDYYHWLGPHNFGSHLVGEYLTFFSEPLR
jgi:hypothetical protein